MNCIWLRIAGATFLSLCNTPIQAEDGVFKDKIVFGQVAALNGPAQALGQGMREGILAAFEEAFDEEGTLRQLKAHRKELIDPKITEHRGRIVKTTGDGMLLEFVSVVDAVRCAVDIQRAMIERTAQMPPEKRIQFRIGINVGDIIIDGDDIYGDGVNVAARLEALADPGGIMVSRWSTIRFRTSSALNSTIWVSKPSKI